MACTVRCRCGSTSTCTDMYRGAGPGERFDVAIGVADHQVHVERHLGDALERRDDRRADGDVRHEVPVHDVDVDQVGAAALDGGDRVAERREIRGQNRRRDEDAHRLTSSEIGSPGAIWNPACGFWRSTMPAGMPGYGFEPTTATRKPRCAEDFGGAIAVDADQIRHDVGRAAVAAVHEQRDARTGALCRRLLGHDDIRREVLRADLRQCGQAEAVLRQPELRRPLGLAGERRDIGRTRPGAQPHPDGSLPAGGRAWRRVPAPGRGRRRSSDRSASRRRLSRQPEVAALRRWLRWRSGWRRSGTSTSLARSARRIEAAANTDISRDERAGEHQQLACAPHAPCEGHRS